MRILHTEWSDGWGGQERRIITEIQGMRKRGHDVWLLTRPYTQILEQARQLGIPFYCAPMRAPTDLASIFYTRRLLNRLNIDIINTHSGIDTWIGGIASRLGKKVVFIRTRHLDIPLKRHPINFIHYLPDRIISCGTMIQKHLIAECGFPAKQIVNIPTGIDFEHFRPTKDRNSVRNELKTSEDCPIILMVGVLRGVKRHLLAIDAFSILKKKHPKAKLFLAGDGPMRTDIENRIEKLNLQKSIQLLGYREDIPDLMQAADQLWLTSRSEGVPQAITQALGMKLPIVSTNVGSVSDLIIHQQTGMLAPPENASKIAELSNQLLLDATLSKQISQRGYSHALTHFSLCYMLTATEALYEECYTPRA